MEPDQDSFNDFFNKGQDDEDISELIDKIAAHKDIIDSSELDKDLDNLFVNFEPENTQSSSDEQNSDQQNHFYEKIELLAQELHKATLNTDKRLNKIENEIKEEQVPEFAKLCEDMELDYFLGKHSDQEDVQNKVDNDSNPDEILTKTVKDKSDQTSMGTVYDGKVKAGLASIIFFIDNFIYLFTGKSIFSRIIDNKSEQNLLRLDNNLVGLDFSSFAMRPHDNMGIEIASEKHRDRDSLLTLVALGLGLWIITMIITGLVQMPDRNFVLESFSEWELRMSNDPVLSELFNSQINGNNLSDRNQTLASINASSNSGQQVAGARVGISGGSGETGVYRALRVLSAGTNSYLGSGDASIQDLLENPGQVSISAPAGTNSGNLGSNQVMQSVHSDTVALTSAQGGELSHQARVEISPPQSLTGEPEALVYRDNPSINRIIVRHRGAIQYLYNSYRENNPYLSGQVVMNLVIDSRGRVLAANIVSSDMGAPDFVDQLRTMVMMWQFPPLEDSTLSPVTVTIPFNFIDF